MIFRKHQRKILWGKEEEGEEGELNTFKNFKWTKEIVRDRIVFSKRLLLKLKQY